MKINITKQEYRTLLHLSGIASWVLHAYRDDDATRTAEYRALEQKIYALAAEYGDEDLIVHDEKKKISTFPPPSMKKMVRFWTLSMNTMMKPSGKNWWSGWPCAMYSAVSARKNFTRWMWKNDSTNSMPPSAYMKTNSPKMD